MKDKIHEWKLDKKHKLCEIQTALHILAERGYDEDTPAPDELCFSIREKLVSVKDIRRYCSRKGNESVARLPEGFQQCSDVVLLPYSDTGARLVQEGSSNSSESNLSFMSHAALPSQRTPTDLVKEHSQWTCVVEHPFNMSLGSLSSVPKSPPPFNDTEILVRYARSYCYSYLDSQEAKMHVEPTIHHFTEHGQFGHKFQDGISAILHQDNKVLAFTHFDSAFGRLGALLKDNHPMSLAQLHAVICELAVRAAPSSGSGVERTKQYALQEVLKALIKHIAALAEYLPRFHPIKAMFDILMDNEQILEHSLRIMQGMVDFFAQNELQSPDSPRWKLLYIKERYCDCLYHAGYDGSRQVLRAQLLDEQRRFYGENKSNVLWTQTNVADDFLFQYRPLDAERLFRDALEKAEVLDVYARAKTRYAALEGLAKVAQWKADNGLPRAKLDWCGNGSAVSALESAQFSINLLQTAVMFCRQAEAEADLRFGLNNRRGIRMAKKRDELTEEIRKRLSICT